MKELNQPEVLTAANARYTNICLLVSKSDGTERWLLDSEVWRSEAKERQCLQNLTYFGFISQILYRSVRQCYTKCLLSKYKRRLDMFCNNLSKY